MILTRSRGRHRTTMPPVRGKNVISDSKGNMPLPPHRVKYDDQNNTEQDCQRVVAHVARLQAAQCGAAPAEYPGDAPAASVQHIAFEQARGRAAKPEQGIYERSAKKLVDVILVENQLIERVLVLPVLEAVSV